MTGSGIYKITSLSHPERFYVGSASNIKLRWKKHRNDLKCGSHHSIKLQRHYNKYGENDLVYSIITICSVSELLMKEQFYIDSEDPYFNYSKVAGSPMKGMKHSKETLVKIGMAWKGRKHTPETKLKMAESATGKHPTEETRKKLSLAKKGIHLEEGHREKIRQRALGNKHVIGKHWNLSDETKERMSQAQKLRFQKSA